MGRLCILPPALGVIKISALHPNESKLAFTHPIQLLVLWLLFQWDLLGWESGRVLGSGRMSLSYRSL